MGLQSGNQLAGDFPVVDVGSDFGAGRGHFLLRIAPFHHQRRPLFDLLMIFRIANPAEQLTLLERRVTRAQEIHIVFAPHKAHVRHAVNKRFRLTEYAACHLVSPKLPGDVEGFVDIDRFVDINPTGGLWRVVQLHQSRMTGTRIVPAVRALFSHAGHLLDHGNRPVRLKFLKPGSQRGAHDAAANQQYIRLLLMAGVGPRCI